MSELQLRPTPMRGTAMSSHVNVWIAAETDTYQRYSYVLPHPHLNCSWDQCLWEVKPCPAMSMSKLQLRPTPTRGTAMSTSEMQLRQTIMRVPATAIHINIQITAEIDTYERSKQITIDLFAWHFKELIKVPLSCYFKHVLQLQGLETISLDIF